MRAHEPSVPAPKPVYAYDLLPRLQGRSRDPHLHPEVDASRLLRILGRYESAFRRHFDHNDPISHGWWCAYLVELERHYARIGEVLRAAAAKLVPGTKTCGKCGKVYDAAAYAALPPPPDGDRMEGDGCELLLRNCPCGSTLAWKIAS